MTPHLQRVMTTTTTTMATTTGETDQEPSTSIMDKRKIPYIYLIPTIYLALWSIIFSIWSFIDGESVYEAFNLDLDVGDDFVLQNSGARYLGIATSLWVSILIFRDRESLLTALSARVIMDIFDVVGGIRTGTLPSPIIVGIWTKLLTIFRT